MQTLILTLHIIVCVLLVILVLLQAGKEGMGVIFGGGNTSVFGAGGAGGMLAKLTAFVGFLFICTSLSYTLVTSPRSDEGSAVLDVNAQFEESPAKDAKPGAPAPATPENGTTAAPAAKPEPAVPASENTKDAAQSAIKPEAVTPAAESAKNAGTKAAPATKPAAAPASKPAATPDSGKKIDAGKSPAAE